MFASYARNIPDIKEREKLRKTYLARNICFAVFMFLCVAIIAEAFIFDKQFDSDDPSNAVMVLLMFTLLAWIGTGIASLVFFWRFRKRYRAALLRPAVEGETPEEAAFRKETVKTQASDRKATLWALIVLIVCVAAMVVCIVLDNYKHPDSDKLYALSYVGMGIGIAGILVYFFAVLRNNIKKSTADTERTTDAAQIDALQGRKPRYRLQEDKNLNKLTYVYPTPELREQAQAIRKKHGKVVLISTFSAMIAGLIVMLVLIFGDIFDKQYRGYAYPVYLALLFATIYLSSLPFVLRLYAVEKKQREITQNDPALQKHWQIYKAYNTFAKGKGIVIHISLALGLVLSFVLAAVSPDTMLSLCGVLPICAGIVLHNLFLRRLRQSVIPIEKEIDGQNDLTSVESHGEYNTPSANDEEHTVSVIADGSRANFDKSKTKEAADGEEQ